MLMHHLRTALSLMLFLLCLSALAEPDSTQYIIIREIQLKGNDKTRDYILLRELTFAVGDTLSKIDLQLALLQSRQNLLNQPLFHFVEVIADENPDDSTVSISIQVQERWYTWVWPIFEISDRNFNAWLQNGDFTRLSYGIFFQQENFRGRLEKLHIRLKLGYQQQLAILYEIPYLNKAKTLGLGFTFDAGRQREVGYATVNDKLQYHRGDDFLRHSLDGGVYIKFRPQIHITHLLQYKTSWIDCSDSLLILNPDYAGDAGATFRYPSINYLFKADFRDQRAYPLAGWYADAELTRFGLSKTNPLNFFTLRASARLHLPLAPRWHTAFLLAGKLSSPGNKPYYLNQALGYRRDYVRGYEYYVVDGDHFWLAKSTLKYTLIRPAIKQINWLKSPKFNSIPYAVYLNAFADVGQVWPGEGTELNRFSGRILPGIGLGLDFVTYYDKVVRAEFSLNGEGEAGFFIHFMAAI